MAVKVLSVVKGVKVWNSIKISNWIGFYSFFQNFPDFSKMENKKIFNGGKNHVIGDITRNSNPGGLN